jgi:hypothetical protein
VLEAADPDTSAVKIVEREPRRFAPTEAVSVREVEEEEIAYVVDLIKETFDLAFREVLDGFLLPSPNVHSIASPRTESDSNGFPQKRS